MSSLFHKDFEQDGINNSEIVKLVKVKLTSTNKIDTQDICQKKGLSRNNCSISDFCNCLDCIKKYDYERLQFKPYWTVVLHSPQQPPIKEEI